MIAFLHIHKTAGTSLRYMLANAFNNIYPVPTAGSFDKFPNYPTQDNYPMIVQDELGNGELDSYELVMGHFDWGLVKHLPKDSTILVMLRDPIEQLYSQLRWFHADTERYGHDAELLYHLGLTDYLKSNRVERYCNHQTKFLSGAMWANTTLSTGLLTYAKRNLKGCVFGLSHRFDESIELFERAIGRSLGKRLYRNQNAHLAKPLSLHDRDLMERLQSYDMSLYDYALRHFDKQFEDKQ